MSRFLAVLVLILVCVPYGASLAEAVPTAVQGGTVVKYEKDDILVSWPASGREPGFLAYGVDETAQDRIAFAYPVQDDASSMVQARITDVEATDAVYFFIINAGAAGDVTGPLHKVAPRLDDTASLQADGLASAKRIGIEAGHGGSDSGAMSCDGTRKEADNTIGVANLAASRLRSMGHAVDILRGGDSRMRGYRADAFVSLHNDWCAGSNTGYKVSRYGGRKVYGTNGSNDASDRLTLKLWDRYGAVTDMAQDRSAGHFTNNMLNYYALGWIDRSTPGAIIEMGWWSGDEDMLVNQRGVLAEGIVQGVLASMGQTDSNDGQSLAMGGSRTGSLGSNSDVDCYLFDGRAGQKVTVTMRRDGGSVDSWLELYAPDGRCINSPRSDDDRGGGYDAKIDGITLPSHGRYIIYARSWASRSSGQYRISLSEGTSSVQCPGQYKAEYWSNRSLSGSPRVVRCEGWPIRHDWGNGSPSSSIPSDNFSARWTGRASFEGGEYDFIARADDGIRVWLDGTLVINGWRDQAPTDYRSRRTVSAGEHDLKIEYYERGGGAVAEFRFAKVEHQEPGRIQVVSSLRLDDTTLTRGQNATARFTIKNVGGQAVRIEALTAAARTGSSWSGAWCDFPHAGSITLQPGRQYTYSKSRSFDTTGSHFCEPAMLVGGSWTGIEGGNRVTFSVNSGGGSSRGNLTLNKPVYVTSVEGSGYQGARGVDGNSSTRWSSAINSNLGSQWYIVDLGETMSFDRFRIEWESAYARRYWIAWSNDGRQFYGYRKFMDHRANINHEISTKSARYVALYMYERAPRMNNYSLYEFEVYGSATSSAADLKEPVQELLFEGDLFKQEAARDTETPSEVDQALPSRQSDL